MPARGSARARSQLFAPTAAAPSYLTSLVGRDRELAELAELVRGHRLVSLVGVGGSGKTRLAAAVAADAEGRGKGAVAWIDLAPLTDPELVASHMATTLGLRERGTRTAADGLIEMIDRNPVLLVLDNCEHLVGASCVIVDFLLRGCPHLRVLTTSRQLLGIAGEKAWHVPPLSLPDAEGGDVAGAGAVQLFVHRAADVLPSFALTPANADAVARICRRLDGLPLAIELAAARVKLLPPEQLASRLESAFDLLSTSSQLALPRHRTLHGLIDWSYDLLSPDERTIFERLSVFAGGFTLDAAERVVGFGSCETGDVLELLGALVDKSLVTMREWRGEARYSLLTTVHLYAQARLESDPAAADEIGALQRRHALHYLELAEAAGPRLRTCDQLDWLRRLEVEHDNLRAALRWSIVSGAPDLALRLCIALHDFWRVRGHLTEGRKSSEEALAMKGGADALRARAFIRLAVLVRMLGDHAVFGEHVAVAHELAGEIGDPIAEADALTQLGVALRERRDLRAAVERLDEAIRRWRELDDPRGLSLALGIRASIATAEGDTVRARSLRVEAVEVARRAGDAEAEAHGLIGLGEVARLERDLEGARAYNERSLRLFQEIGDLWQAASVQQNLGWIFADLGELEASAAAFNESIARFRRTGNPFGVTLCLFGLARLLQEHGDPESAATAIAAAAANAARVGLRPAAPADVLACERTTAAVEAALDTDRLARSRDAGLALDLLEAISRAQEKLRTHEPPRHSPAPRPASPVRVDRRATPAAKLDSIALADLRVHALGPLQIYLGDRLVEGDAFGSAKPRELLVFLLCHPGGCTREQVGLAFWPDSSAAQVKNSFHVTLHRLRKALDRPEWIVATNDRYLVDPDVRVDFDAVRFEKMIDAGLRERREADAIDGLGSALGLYRGEFLEAEVVGDWHLTIRERLHRRYLDGLLAYAKLLLAADRLTDAADTLRTLVTREPMNEEAARELMGCYERTGQRVQALGVFENLSFVLAENFGTGPDPATRALFERLQQPQSA